MDWKSDKETMFYPNPLRQSYGQFEITKVPAPGTVSIKIYNIAGDLVRDGGNEGMKAGGVKRRLEQIKDNGGVGAGREEGRRGEGGEGEHAGRAGQGEGEVA